MKNRFQLSWTALVCLSGILFVGSHSVAQTAIAGPYPADVLLSGDVQAVSARIASLYGPDAETVELYVNAALNLEGRIGIAAPVIIGIAIHESSFKSDLFANSGNPFGIKAGKPWTGPTFSKWEDGNETKFRVYGSAEEAIWDFSTFVRSRSWYADALACPVDDSRCVIDGLKRTSLEPGYSLNPNWDESILDIIHKVGLQALTTR